MRIYRCFVAGQSDTGPNSATLKPDAATYKAASSDKIQHASLEKVLAKGTTGSKATGMDAEL